MLLFDTKGSDVERVWITPGGGLEPGESYEEAASRELFEETGLRAQPGPWVWRRRHVWHLDGIHYESIERYFLVRAPRFDLRIQKPEEVEWRFIRAHRWWSVPEITAAADQVFAPRRLAALVAPLARGELPPGPLDAGV